VRVTTVDGSSRLADASDGRGAAATPEHAVDAAPARRSFRRTAWLLVRNTTIAAFRYRVTGLAAEAAFFALVSLPPLIIGLVGTMGHFRGVLGAANVNEIREWTIAKAHTVLTDAAVDTVVVPLTNEVIRGGRVDIISIGFLISLWAGSRATNVYVDTITIAYGLSGVRGVIRTRLRAFFLYIVGLLVMIVLIPLLVVGPALVRRALPATSHYVLLLYWPTVVTLSILFLAMLYHMSIPVRTSWFRQVPGAAVALVIWVAGSIGLRLYLGRSMSGVSVYGSLAASIAILAWLYVAALAVLIGAALNAEIDREWPGTHTALAREARSGRGTGEAHENEGASEAIARVDEMAGVDETEAVGGK
jgi:membrane protein